MTKLIDCVLLIDDDRPTNFYNSTVLSKHQNFADVHIRQSGEAALIYLKEVERGTQSKPSVIFLDINMPAMNGWEFLVEYSKLDPNLIADIKVIMLTTSANPKDIETAAENFLIKDFINKPLSFPILNDIIEKHFCKLNSNEKTEQSTTSRR